MLKDPDTELSKQQSYCYENSSSLISIMFPKGQHEMLMSLFKTCSSCKNCIQCGIGKDLCLQSTFPDDMMVVKGGLTQLGKHLHVKSANSPYV